MVTCANCTNEALYVYKPGPEFSLNYCQYHLPRFLTRSENPSVFLVEKEVPKVAEVKASKKKETEAVAEVSSD